MEQLKDAQLGLFLVISLLNDLIKKFDHFHKLAIIVVELSTLANGVMLRSFSQLALTARGPQKGYYNGCMELENPLSTL